MLKVQLMAWRFEKKCVNERTVKIGGSRNFYDEPMFHWNYKDEALVKLFLQTEMIWCTAVLRIVVEKLFRIFNKIS